MNLKRMWKSSIVNWTTRNCAICVYFILIVDGEGKGEKMLSRYKQLWVYSFSYMLILLVHSRSSERKHRVCCLCKG
jgi:hypothetical protein